MTKGNIIQFRPRGQKPQCLDENLGIRSSLMARQCNDVLTQMNRNLAGYTDVPTEAAITSICLGTGHALHDLFETIRHTMPQHAEGIIEATIKTIKKGNAP